MEGEKLLEASMYLVFWFLFYPWLFTYTNTRQSGMACFSVNVNSCSLFPPVHLWLTLAHSLTLLLFLDFIVKVIKKKDLF